MPLIQVGDIRMYYEESGQGEPVLFVSGAGVDHACWAPLAGQLRGAYRCVTFDNRGVGQSDKPLPPYSIAQMARDAMGLVDYLGISGFHLAGHSMGGYVAQEVALAVPDRCRSLTLIGTGSHVEPYTAFLMELRKALTRRLERQRFLEATATWMFSPASFRHKRDVIDNFIQGGAKTLHPQPEYAYDGHLDGCVRFSSEERLGRILVPTLVMVGDDDVLTPPYLSRELAEGIPGARLVTVAEAGHMVLLEQPNLLAKEMKEFLDGVSRGASR